MWAVFFLREDEKEREGNSFADGRSVDSTLGYIGRDATDRDERGNGFVEMLQPGTVGVFVAQFIDDIVGDSRDVLSVLLAFTDLKEGDQILFGEIGEEHEGGRTDDAEP